MYLYLGKNTTVTQRSVVGIFDLDTASYSHITREYLKNAQQAGKIINISDDLPRSFVICESPDDGVTLLLSQLNSSTLMKRSEIPGSE